MLRAAESRAKKQGIRFDLIEQDIVDMWGEQAGLCYWFKLPMAWMEDRNHPQQPSIDRVVPGSHYSRGNVVLACLAANHAKGATEPDEWERFLEHLRAGMCVT